MTGESPLFLEETAELVHHAAAAPATAVGGRGTTVATTVAGGRGATGALVAVLVLLDSVFGNATHDGSTDSSEEPVVSLVTGETTGRTTSESASETTLALLGFTGSTLLLLIVATEKGVSMCFNMQVRGGGRRWGRNETYPWRL